MSDYRPNFVLVGGKSPFSRKPLSATAFPPAGLNYGAPPQSHSEPHTRRPSSSEPTPFVVPRK